MKVRFQLLTLIYLILCLFSGLLYQVLILYLCLCVHELGHLVVIKLFKKKVTLLEISPIGGILYLDGCQNDRNFKELLIYLGGPLISFSLYFLVRFFKLNEVFIASSYYIFLMNLIPIIPLDGGKIIMTLKQYFITYKLVLKLISVFSVITGIILVIICIKTTSLSIILMSFIYINLKNYLNISEEYFTFLWYKYLHPNKKLPKKIIISRLIDKHIIYHHFYKGYHHVFFLEHQLLDEEDVLKRLLISK